MCWYNSTPCLWSWYCKHWSNRLAGSAAYARGYVRRGGRGDGGAISTPKYAVQPAKY